MTHGTVYKRRERGQLLIGFTEFLVHCMSHVELAEFLTIDCCM